MNIFHMTEKQIQRAIKEPLPKGCKYGSIEELLIWSFDVLDARSRCEVELSEFYNFEPVYHQLSGKQKAVYNAIVRGDLEFYFAETRAFALPIINQYQQRKRHGNYR